MNKYLSKYEEVDERSKIMDSDHGTCGLYVNVPLSKIQTYASEAASQV